MSEERFDQYISIIVKDRKGNTRSEHRRKMRCPEPLLFIKELDALYLKYHPEAKPQDWLKIIDVI